ncbi:MAG: anhydro-N-acetylmuramic acid kinase [Gammaproteobacteria bacterium]|jgi:anhydro-N-acetylmuramic acid kinase|nr:anhydro-N-acetylmuramic acid kinase [Gammaproteobacteria bacterium]
MPASRSGQRNPSGPSASDLYVGLMSGTSMDGVDAALVDFADEAPRLLAFRSEPYPAPLRRRLLQLAQGTDDELARTAQLDAELGRLFAQATLAVIDQGRVRRRAVSAIGSHGQTLRHFPKIPSSLQIADPNIIATATGITTVADFRRRDMSVGGQGAPLAPAFHEILFRVRSRTRVVLNVGGIANITLLPRTSAQPVSGFDTGPGNTLMDRWAERHLKQPMDTDGHWAAGGNVDERLLARLLKERYFRAPPPKSTGTEYFNMRWLENHLARENRRIPHRDVQTTLCELTARTITDAIRRHAPDTDEVLVCGGGAYNLALMFRLQVLLDTIPVRSTEDFGVEPTRIEAMTFAWLARQTILGRPGNLPSVTGAGQAVVLGAVYGK